MFTEVTNVWESSAKTPEEATRLQLRAQMMLVIRQIIHEKGWDSKEASEHLEISQPRVSYLLNGQVTKFSMEKLLELLYKIGFRFSLQRDDDGTPSFITDKAA